MTATVRDEINEACGELVTGLAASRLALYPPGDKRRLPDDIPTTKDFRAMRKQIEAVRLALLDMCAGARGGRQALFVRLRPSALAFLRLPDEFDGWYKREVLVKALNMHATLADLSTAEGIRVDERLALCADEMEPGSLLQRKEIFALVSALCERPPADAEPPSEQVVAAIAREQDELNALAEVLAELRHARAQVTAIEGSRHVALLARELESRRQDAERLQQRLHEVAATTRLFSSDDQEQEEQ
jgi:hypothetical protein